MWSCGCSHELNSFLQYSENRISTSETFPKDLVYIYPALFLYHKITNTLTCDHTDACRQADLLPLCMWACLGSQPKTIRPVLSSTMQSYVPQHCQRAVELFILVNGNWFQFSSWAKVKWKATSTREFVMQSATRAGYMSRIGFI